MQVVNGSGKAAARIVISFDCENLLAHAPLRDPTNYRITYVTTRNEHISPCVRHLALNRVVVRDDEQSHNAPDTATLTHARAAKGPEYCVLFKALYAVTVADLEI